MKNLIFVRKVNPSSMVRDPYTGKPLPPSGQLVPNNAYWLARINAGIVEEVKRAKGSVESIPVLVNESEEPKKKSKKL